MNTFRAELGKTYGQLTIGLFWMIFFVVWMCLLLKTRLSELLSKHEHLNHKELKGLTLRVVEDFCFAPKLKITWAVFKTPVGVVLYRGLYYPVIYGLYRVFNAAHIFLHFGKEIQPILHAMPFESRDVGSCPWRYFVHHDFPVSCCAAPGNIFRQRETPYDMSDLLKNCSVHNRRPLGLNQIILPKASIFLDTYASYRELFCLSGFSYTASMLQWWYWCPPMRFHVDVLSQLPSSVAMLVIAAMFTHSWLSSKHQLI